MKTKELLKGAFSSFKCKSLILLNPPSIITCLSFELPGEQCKSAMKNDGFKLYFNSVVK